MQINTLLQQAYGYHQQGELSRARDLYEQALGIDGDNQDALVLLGALHYESDDYETAVAYFEKLLRLAPERTDFLPNLAAALQLSQRPQEAAVLYRRVLELTPEDPSAHYNLAAALRDSGDSAAAIARFERALELAPDYAKAHNSLGAVYRQLGQFEAARRHFTIAAELAPDYALAWINLGDTERQQGQAEAAAGAYTQAARLVPTDAGLQYQLGRLYQELGQLEASLQHLNRAVELQPQFAAAWRSLGMSQQTLGQYQASLASFEQAISLQPDYAEALNNLGNSLRELGDVEAAAEAYRSAQALAPSDANRLRLATLLPPIYADTTAVGQWRQRYREGLEALAGSPLKIADPLTEVGQTNFYLAYQGGDDRPLQERVAALYRPLLPETVAADPAAAGSRKRVGVLSAFLYHHTVSHYYQRHIELLAASEEIELILLLAPGNQRDATTDALLALADRHLQLTKDLALARKEVAGLGLDVLVYLDIGLEPFSYFLAYTRLAPIQCVLPGHPVTTGIPTIDYYVSNRWMERDDADKDYSEQLVSLDSLPVWYRRPQLPEQRLSRQELGFSPHERLYVCPMTLFKIHPDMDASLSRILAADPQARILFFRFRQTQLHEQLAARFAREIPEHERIQFLPWADAPTYFSLLEAADVLLDSFHFGGGSTHFLCFATGTPLITWPSAYLRGRSGAGIYRRIGVEDAIADSQSDFADRAVAIAGDADRRARLRSAILAAGDTIFENDEGPRSFVSWILSL